MGVHPLCFSNAMQLILTNRSNRQDAREALEIASMGKIRCHYALKPLSALSEYVSSQTPQYVADRPTLLGYMKAWNRVRLLDALC